MPGARHLSHGQVGQRLRGWRAELRDHGLGTAILLRLRQHAGTNELARSVAGYFDANNERVDRLERLTAIPAVMAWIEQATLATAPLVSVITPTFNRAPVLPHAIASVLAQTYPNWELLLVDDGSEGDTGEVLESLSDPRIRTLRIEHAGAGAARNVGLEAARGELVAYLDDDNTMHPGWLKSVVWGFEQRPDADILYGGLVIDDVDRGADGIPASLPAAFINPFDRERISEDNLADMSAIAHRARLPGARFDETLVTMADWDLLARLCAEREPLVLPAIACFYSTAAPDRLTGGPTEPDDAALVRERVRGQLSAR